MVNSKLSTWYKNKQSWKWKCFIIIKLQLVRRKTTDSKVWYLSTCPLCYTMPGHDMHYIILYTILYSLVCTDHAADTAPMLHTRQGQNQTKRLMLARQSRCVFSWWPCELFILADGCKPCKCLSSADIVHSRARNKYNTRPIQCQAHHHMTLAFVIFWEDGRLSFPSPTIHSTSCLSVQ